MSVSPITKRTFQYYFNSIVRSERAHYNSLNGQFKLCSDYNYSAFCVYYYALLSKLSVKIHHAFALRNCRYTLQTVCEWYNNNWMCVLNVILRYIIFRLAKHKRALVHCTTERISYSLDNWLWVIGVSSSSIKLCIYIEVIYILLLSYFLTMTTFGHVLTVIHFVSIC